MAHFDVMSFLSKKKEVYLLFVNQHKKQQCAACLNKTMGEPNKLIKN